MRVFNFLIFFYSLFSLGQNSFTVPDSLSNLKYKEDQFYIGTNYILLKGDNDLVQQNDFSSQVYFGFLRDFSINKRGNFALAIGLGPSYTQFQSNIDFKTGSILSQTFNTVQYMSLNLPLEIRWRSSDPKTFSFWRIYLGTQIQYNFISDKIGALKKFTSVSTLNLGYNTWNFSIGYDLYPRLKEFESIQSTKLKILTIGLIFYIF